MLKPKALTQVLSQANTGGVENTLLLNQEGALLAYSSYSDRDGRHSQQHLECVREKRAQRLQGDHPQMILMECTDGRIAITRVANF